MILIDNKKSYSEHYLYIVVVVVFCSDWIKILQNKEKHEQEKKKKKKEKKQFSYIL